MKIRKVNIFKLLILFCLIAIAIFIISATVKKDGEKPFTETVFQEVSALEQAPQHTHSALIVSSSRTGDGLMRPQQTELNRMYEASRAHNTCQQIKTNISNSNKKLRQNFENTLATIEDDQQWFLAIMLMHTLEILDAQDTISRIERNRLKKVQKEFDGYLTRYENNQPPPTHLKMMSTFSDIAKAMQLGQYASIPELIVTFQNVSGKKGFVTRSQGGNLLVMPDTIVGHMIVGIPAPQLEALISNIEITPTMLTQAVRSGGDTLLIGRLLASLDFTNQPVYTKTNKLQTTLQAAIESSNIEVLRLLLDQPSLKNVRYAQSPVNTLLLQALSNKGGQILNEQQISILKLLRDYGYGAEVLPNKSLKQMELIGYKLALLPPEMIEQVKTFELPARIVQRLTTPDISLLSREIKVEFDETAFQLSEGQTQYQEQEKLCKPLKETWIDAQPENIMVNDITPYLQEDLSVNEQVSSLAAISPAMVDAYYTYSLKQAAGAADIDTLMLKIKDIGSDFVKHQRAISHIDLTLYQRHYLAKQLCEKFGDDGVYASFTLSKYIDFSDYDPMNCLIALPEFFVQIKTDFFDHAATFPGLVFYQIEGFSINEAIQTLEKQKNISAKHLAGYPQGSDALMRALDLKNRSRISGVFDYYTLIYHLLEVTELNSEHMQRLHKLKVANILMFEKLSAKFPIILNAEQYPFNIYSSY